MTSWAKTLVATAVLALLPGLSAAAPRVVDRTAVRYVSPETGGRPKFLTEREIAFFARLEGLIEDGVLASDFLDRFARTAVDRTIAEDMLASLQVQRGVEPPELLKLAREFREALETRVGGPGPLLAAARAEGLEPFELDPLFLRRARAVYYADTTLVSLLRPSDEELFAAFRSLAHPYKSMKFEDARVRFLRWYSYERFRSVEVDFVLAARSRLTITYL